MRKWIALVLLLLVGAEVFAQGSAPSPPQLWRRKGTADTSFVVIKTGDTVMVYDTAQYTKLDLRGTNQYWLIPDSVRTATLISNEMATSSLTISGIGFIMNTFAEGPDTIWSLLGNGHEIVNGYLTVTLGSSIEGSEVTNQTLTKSDIDTTATFPFGALYHKTTAVSDSEYKSKYYIDHNLFGYTVTGTPSNGQVAVYDGGTGGWTFGAGGSGSGDDGVFDMTLSNADYVLGATTYTGGYINTSTHWQRGDTGINIVKSGQHPGDTMLHQIDWVRVMRNNGTQYVYNFRSAAEDTMGTVYDSAAYTIWRTGGTTAGGAGNSGGLKMNNVLNMGNNIRFWGNGRRIDSVSGIRGYTNYLSINSDSGLYLNPTYVGGVANVPVIIGSSSNYTFHADSLYGTGNGLLSGLKRAITDTIVPTRIRQDAGSTFIVTSTDTTLKIVRDTTNDTTKLTSVGALMMEGSAGRYYIGDSGNIAGKVWLENSSGTNGTLDSAQHVQADTVIGKTAAKLLGSTSGSVVLKATATAGSTVYTLPTDGTSGQALITNGSGVLSWTSAAGGGNGSADVDSTDDLDSNIWKGAGGTILLDVHKNSTPSVVIGKGATMTSLILGGNSSGLSSIDTSVLVYNRLYFGATVNKQTAIDSTFVYDQLKKHRYYFGPGDFWGSPEAYAVRYTFTSWNESDTTGTFPNSMYKRGSLFYARDTNGVNVLPYNFTWVAPSRDSLFSTVYTVKSGFTDVDSSSLYAAALYVNETKVDTLNPLKASVAYTIDSLDWTDRAIAAGDVVTVLLYLKLNPTAASKKRVDFKEMYLNMRRY